MKPVLYALSLCMMAGPGVARAQSPDSPVFIIDVASLHLPSKAARSTVVRLSTLNEALSKITPPQTDEDRKLRGTPAQDLLDACQAPSASATPRPIADVPAIIKGLFDCFDCISAHQETRFTVTRGAQVLLLVIYKSPISLDQLKPYFSEVPRSSELVATAKALRSLLTREAPDDLACHAFTYQLQRPRSFLKVVLPVPGGGDVLETTAAEATTVTSPEATVGPEERWFMSADFSISKASASIGKQPTPGEEELKSKDFFVGLNFALGDLLVDRRAPMQRRSLLRELLIKVQATPSRSPWEAWAVGVGLRGLRMQTILWNFDVVHPYVTVGRETLPDDQRRWRAVFGLGFDPRSLVKQE